MVYLLTEDEALRCDDGMGCSQCFSWASKLRNAPQTQRSRAEQYPASYDMPRRSESGSSGGWGTTLLCVPAQRPYVPGYAPYLAGLDGRPSAENGEAGANCRALFASTLAGCRQG